MISEDIVEALTTLKVKLEHIEKAVEDLKSEVKTSRTPVLPTTGGLAGLVAAVWVGYLQASGKA